MEKAWYQQASRRLAVLVFLFGLLTLIGWGTKIPSLLNLLPSPKPTAPLSALCMTFLGMSLWLTNPLTSLRIRRCGKLFAGIVLLLAGLRILAILFALDLPLGMPPMFLGAALGILLCSLSLLIIDQSDQATPPYQYLSVAAFALGIFGLTNFAFSGENQGLPFFFMSSGSAISLLFTAIATLFLTPDRGIMGIVTSDTSAGMMLRRLFPALLGMFAIRWLRLMGESFHFFTPAAGEGVVGILYFILGYGMVWWSGVLLYKSERGRQKMEALTLEQARHIESILASTSDALYYIDNEGRYRYVSRKGAEILSRPPSDILGKTGEEFGLPPNTNQQVEKLRQRVLSSGTPVRGTFHYPPEKTYEYIIAPVKDANGILQGTVASLRDITEREQILEELRQSNERFAKAFQANPNPLLISRLDDGRLVDVNDAAIRNNGFSREEMIGHTSIELGLLTPKERKRIIRTLMAQKKLVALPFVYHTKNKEERQGLYSADTFENRGERFMISIISDVTEQVKAEQERQALQRQQIRLLQEAAHMKDQFLSVISHELRTPLNAISGFGSLLEDGVAGPLTPQQLDYVTKILRGSDRMLILIDDLLDFARIQAGGFGISQEECDYDALVEETMESFAPAAEEKKITLEKDIRVHAPVVMDRRRIQQVLSNLITNSLKFTPSKGQIRIKAWISGDRLITEVSDNGQGIAPEDISKLFTPFQQLDMSLTRKVGGVGLGLSISKSIVEAHGGRIQALSEGLGKGTTIRFELPQHPSPKPPEQKPAE